jgi:hypothetical protein
MEARGGTTGGMSDGAAGSPSLIGARDGASAGSIGDARSDSVSVAPADNIAAGPLFIEAVGGPVGVVAAEVELSEPGVGQKQTCTQPLNAGTCQLTSCQGGGVGSPVAGYGNFGPVSVSVGGTTVLMTYGGFGYPTVGFPSSIALGEGGIMEFRGGGSGGGVPAFDISVTIPGLAVMSSPALATDGGSAIIDTSRDLSVTWAPISIGQVQFKLEAVIPPTLAIGIGPIVSVACTFEGASGSGVVPQALLSSLKVMAGTNPMYAGLSSGLDVTTVVDGLPILTRSAQGTPAGGRDIEVILQ